MGKVLIVSDEPQRPLLASALENSQHVVMHAAGIEEVGRTIGANQFDAILTQEKLQDGTAADVLALTCDGCVWVSFSFGERNVRPCDREPAARLL